MQQPGQEFQWVPYTHAGCLGHYVNGKNIIEDKERGGYWYKEEKSAVAGLLFLGALVGLGYMAYKAITQNDDEWDTV